LLDGGEPTLIDAGTGEPEHLEAIGRALGGRRLVRVLVTHGHADHAAGVPALTATWPGLDARMWSPGGAAHAALSEGEIVRAGDVHLRVVHTPGHARDHVCLFDRASRDLYGGDMIVRGSTVMVPPAPDGSMRDYLTSLEKLAALRPGRVFPGHGPIIDEPLELIREYIEHRRLREAQIVALLAQGVSDVDAIVSRIYADLPDPVRPAARLTVQSHLEKLRGR